MSAAAGVREATDAGFAEEVLGAGLPVLVMFTSERCPPCRMMAPVLAEVAEERHGRIEVARIDVDANPETTLAYGVLGTPTLILFDGGEPVRSLVGARPKRRLLRELRDL
ncbi:thioredoxin family protein [Nocardiopsis composta]|uniref:Thioredoxin n=1 Tax=Nocardiopsis composta TaxID=157465 RepID=A0A7W8QN97_9ACTN|nr:thioredoxin domain-containing protein [Nocardiopsis composta]MBB5433411.1 thioredoxin 1 [Nocardiopsis composta]